jgi:hypothetical protein
VGDTFRMKQFIDRLEVPLIPNLFKPAPNDCRVFVFEHARSMTPMRADRRPSSSGVRDVFTA